LEKMNTPEIQELLKEDRAKLEVFCSKFLEAMIAAGHMASSKELGKMQIGKRCWNLEHLFVRRSIPDAIPRMILWIEDQLANRNPYDRAGHYKMD